MGETFKRTSKPKVDKRVSLKSVEDMKALAKSELYGMNNENVILVCLDNAKRVKKIVHISEGDKTESFIDVRKAVQIAIDCEAASVFVAHNHPENSCEPSASDIDATRALCVMFRKLGFLLVDHIIIGSNNEAYSMRSDPLLHQMFY
jgi:DNA repair protein RadC